MKVKFHRVVRRVRNGRIYYYFRYGVDGRGYGGKLIALPGVPGTREFQTAYDGLLREHAPGVVALAARRTGRGVLARGSLGWVIIEYKTKSSQWAEAKGSTREVYDRRHHWLAANYGSVPIASFDRELMKEIRDLPEFATKKSVADGIVGRFGTLWDFAEEHCHLPEMRAHNGINPARNVKKLKSGEAASAPLWPLTLCKVFEAHRNRDAVTFYYLARYTGQRRSDLVTMEWDHVDKTRGDHGEMFVSQVKTSARIWVPMPKRLSDYLDTLPRTGRFIVTSAKTGEGWLPTSVTNEFNRITAELGIFPTDTQGARLINDRGNARTFSPHGLRHLCGVELAHAGASDRQIAAVLGQSTLKMVAVYVKQADQLMLARGAVQKRDAMYERERLEAMIAAADNVARLHAVG
jgi:integrase